MQIFADGFSKISLSNHNLRVELVQNGADNRQEAAGTLIIPINQAPAFVNSLVGSLNQLDEQLKAQVREETPGQTQ